MSEWEIIDGLKTNPHMDFQEVFLVGESKFNQSIKDMFLEDEMDQLQTFRENVSEQEVKEFHHENQQKWLMPEKYKNFNIESLLFSFCNTEEEKSRVQEELELYKKFELLDMLKYLKYLWDAARKHQIIWGIGRGSSCSSYCLYLMGIHRVNSLKYGLNIRDFLRS
ncbi:Bacterial DNA polymerase III alpha subunit [uncultured archaeon]|nr:Bacterial DNA polymerase III alpha subunit [uncultured archaeon]